MATNLTTRDNESVGTSSNMTLDTDSTVERLVFYYTMQIGVPSVCCFGMLGNVLNFMVLTREKISHSLTKMEKSAHIGLIALAISDFMFCLLAFLFTQMPFESEYKEVSFVLYYQWLGGSLITWFIITSTWLTVVMAGERYLAVCHPFKARKLISLRRTRIIIFLIYLACLILTIPLGLERVVLERFSEGGNVYYLDKRPGFTDVVLRWRRLAWAVLFDFIPCIALLFFNTCLIWKIHRAKKLRNAMAPGQKKGVLLTKYPRELFSYNNSNSCTNSNHETKLATNRESSISFRSRSSPPETVTLSRNLTPQKRQMKARRRHTDNALNSVTATLVAVVVLFLILVSPSELLKFVYTNSGGENTPTYNIIKNITNLMQAINFSVNFILYCAVNKSFRSSLAAIFCFCSRDGHRNFHLQSLERAYCHRVEFSESES